MPMADGGEGTVDAVLAATGGERRVSTVQGPLGAEVQAARGWLNESRTAVIEMAAASGIHLVLAAERDATRASTFGTGQLVRIPRSSGHPFHEHLTTDSTVIRPPI
ncbi:glycerate kinase, partial [Pseudomonas aeruginosa]|uniref:glycerate kinase n=1 Tax=Pseudomonas aeruginosa TaxID=287 RepID=UPI003896E9CF